MMQGPVSCMLSEVVMIIQPSSFLLFFFFQAFVEQMFKGCNKHAEYIIVFNAGGWSFCVSSVVIVLNYGFSSLQRCHLTILCIQQQKGEFLKKKDSFTLRNIHTYVNYTVDIADLSCLCSRVLSVTAPTLSVCVLYIPL